MIAVLVVALPVALVLKGSSGGWAAIAAAVTVLISSIAGLLASELLPNTSEAVWSVLISMGLRMTIPLVVCLLVLLTGGPLVSGGFVFFVLAFYLVALPVETLLAVLKLRHD